MAGRQCRRHMHVGADTNTNTAQKEQSPAQVEEQQLGGRGCVKMGREGGAAQPESQPTDRTARAACECCTDSQGYAWREERQRKREGKGGS